MRKDLYRNFDYLKPENIFEGILRIIGREVNEKLNRMDEKKKECVSDF